MNKKFDIIYAPIITEKTAMLAQNENKFQECWVCYDPKCKVWDLDPTLESMDN